MVSQRRLHVLLLTLLVAAAMGCAGGAAGEGEESAGGATSEQPPRKQPAQEQESGGPAGGGGESCPDVPVPGHEAVNVRAQGVACSDAAEVAASAGGRGRQAYDAAGFACEPSAAPGGDTDYTCTRGDARVTFRYGTA